MSELRIEKWTLPAANLGPENPLPPIASLRDLHAEIKPDSSVPVEEREHLGWGAPLGLLPYRMQDSYDRTRKPKEFQVVVLENEILRAAFFPCLGGRLWSLVHKPDNRELLARNPVFQPCNLALRNAWLSGGVEWNFGWTGHWPYNCSPLFAGTFRLPDGTPGLRMWEWERVRQMPLQIDAWLPEGSPVLLVRVSLHNPSTETTPVYWWSNIAVEQHPDTRVIVSADEAITSNHENTLSVCGIPISEGCDVSYPGLQSYSGDLFFRVPGNERPWITGLSGQGRGLFQTSTGRLRGRKLYRWGNHAGGRNWQSFLGTPDYIEIQAGLARTQSHHLPMPAGATWSWIEAYGDLQTDSVKIHGKDWFLVRKTVAEAIEKIIPESKLEAMTADSDKWAVVPPNDLICRGSGWGALEAKRRECAGERRMELPGIFFPADSMGAEQQPWLTLLDTGILPEADPAQDPASYQVQHEWMNMLEISLARPSGKHWNSLFHYGVMLWYWNRRGGAALKWMESIGQRCNLWSERCLGVAALVEKRPVDAVSHLSKALAARPGMFPLVIEYVESLLESGRNRELMDFIRTLDKQFRNHGHVRLFEGMALLRLGELDALGNMLAEAPVAVDLREGAIGLSKLWFSLNVAREERKLGRQLNEEEREAVHRAHPCPETIDFRQKE